MRWQRFVATTSFLLAVPIAGLVVIALCVLAVTDTISEAFE